MEKSSDSKWFRSITLAIMTSLILAFFAVSPVNFSAAKEAAPDEDIFTMITAGSYHVCGITTSGAVKCWGMDGAGPESPLPRNIPGLESGVLAIAAGDFHTCAIVVGGAVKCWGHNYYGQLGNGTTQDSAVLVDVFGLTSSVTALTAGDLHTCALTNTGAVKCWGSNVRGQIGSSSCSDYTKPCQVDTLTSGAQAIAAGSQHTCAITIGGGMKCWGSNFLGSVGDNSTTNRYTPTQVIGLESGVVSIEAGEYHTCAVLNGGALKCWGSNTSGQLGDGSTTTRLIPVDVSGMQSGVASVSAGGSSTCARTTTGGARCWGYNAYGQVGNNSFTDAKYPANVSGLSSDISAIATGEWFSCALTTSGKVKCWGHNYYSQLGNGFVRNRPVPVDNALFPGGITSFASGGDFTCVVTTPEMVYCWGYTFTNVRHDDAPRRITGVPTDTFAVFAGTSDICALSPTEVKCWDSLYYTPYSINGLGIGVKSLAIGSSHFCALTSSNGVKCWGKNGSGQLGDGTTQSRYNPADVSGLTSGVKAISANGKHACALLNDGSVKCWGSNTSGQVGNNNTTDSLSPVEVLSAGDGVIAIATGYEHTCVIVTGGGMMCWGRNQYSQLGDGTTENRFIPVLASGFTGVAAGISAGKDFTCVQTTTGAVQCWGRNLDGSLGDGSYVDSIVPVDVLGLQGGVIALSSSYSHSCASLVNGRIKCWGSDWNGELGLGIPFALSSPVDVVNVLPPQFQVNYLTGQSGSLFTLTGLNFPSNADVTLSINDQPISSTDTTSPAGAFVAFLDTTGASTGIYFLTAQSGEVAKTTIFLLTPANGFYPIEGGGQILTMPAAVTPWGNYSIFLPLVIR